MAVLKGIGRRLTRRRGVVILAFLMLVAFLDVIWLTQEQSPATEEITPEAALPSVTPSPPPTETLTSPPTRTPVPLPTCEPTPAGPDVLSLTATALAQRLAGGATLAPTEPVTPTLIIPCDPQYVYTTEPLLPADAVIATATALAQMLAPPPTRVSERPTASVQGGTEAQIAFASYLNGNWDLFLTSSEGGDVRPLTSEPADDWMPAWSPDGTQLAFVSLRDGDAELYLINGECLALLIPCEEATRLSMNAGSDRSPAWSPDGQRISYTSERDGRDQLYLVDAACSLVPEGCAASARPLLISDAWSSAPAWSPDGQRIAFSAFSEGVWTLHLFDLGSGQTRLLAQGARNPDWSPDGTQLVYESFQNDQWDIVLADSDGQNPRNLSEYSADDIDPAWSPDGREIAFATDRGGDYEIYLMNADGSGLRPLTNNNVFDASPAWRP